MINAASIIIIMIENFEASRDCMGYDAGDDDMTYEMTTMAVVMMTIKWNIKNLWYNIIMNTTMMMVVVAVMERSLVVVVVVVAVMMMMMMMTTTTTMMMLKKMMMLIMMLIDGSDDW